MQDYRDLAALFVDKVVVLDLFYNTVAVVKYCLYI